MHTHTRVYIYIYIFITQRAKYQVQIWVYYSAQQLIADASARGQTTEEMVENSFFP